MPRTVGRLDCPPGQSKWRCRVGIRSTARLSHPVYSSGAGARRFAARHHRICLPVTAVSPERFRFHPDGVPKNPRSPPIIRSTAASMKRSRAEPTRSACACHLLGPPHTGIVQLHRSPCDREQNSREILLTGQSGDTISRSEFNSVAGIVASNSEPPCSLFAPWRMVPTGWSPWSTRVPGVGTVSRPHSCSRTSDCLLPPRKCRRAMISCPG